MIVHTVGITLYTAAGFFANYTSRKIIASLASLSLKMVLACTISFVGRKACEFFASWANITITDTIVDKFITGKISSL
jgi:hypothetical protein